MSVYFCATEHRRDAVRAAPGPLNGIDFLEVLDDPSQPNADRQRTLLVHFLKPIVAAPDADPLDAASIRIEGGIGPGRDIHAETVKVDDGHGPNVLVVTLSKRGDFATYTLRLVAHDDPAQQPPRSDRWPPRGYDRQLSAVDFSFKVNCPSDLDCAPGCRCRSEILPEPTIDYQAKDYASFRALLLDRLSVLAPGWTERSPADLGVTMVELLAYAGDYLSYQQDAVATEAYLGTARRRVSVRRHARLVDYQMHDGCNARAWVQVAVDTDLTVRPGLQLATRADQIEQPGAAPLPADRVEPGPAAQVFEAMEQQALYRGHNEIQFHTWGEDDCCLPAGATRASLRNPGNALARLLPGDVLILEEVRGPTSGQPEDADRTHRHAVRLIDVEHVDDPLERDPTDAARPLPVVEITWHAEDALPFTLRVGEVNDPEQPGQKAPISVARGNIVLTDHGRTLDAREYLGAVPKPTIQRVSAGNDGEGGCCEPGRAASDAANAVTANGEARQGSGAGSFAPPRFRPVLDNGPITQATPYDPVLVVLPAADAQPRPDAANPLIPAAVRRALAERNVEPSAFRVEQVRAGEVWVIWALDGYLRTGFVARREPPADGTPVTADSPITVYAPPSATATLRTDPRRALPALDLRGTESSTESPNESSDGTATPERRIWQPRLDLLDSRRDAPDVVVEVEADGSAALRFGDDDRGLRPNVGTAFDARYRVGNGAGGNVGAEAISRVLGYRIGAGPVVVVGGEERETGLPVEDALRAAIVRNPLPAAGGTDMESADEAREYAPVAFRTQERAVTADDYARMAERHPGVQRAAATFRWTGSWHTVFVTVDRRGGLEVDAAFKATMRRFLEPFRMAGHDVEVEGPSLVPIELELTVCVEAGYFQAAVRRALLEALGNRTLPDGRRGLLHPDNLTFGQPVYLSHVYAAAQAVEGVASVSVDVFQRQAVPSSVGLAEGKLTFERLEIPLLTSIPPSQTGASCG